MTAFAAPAYASGLTATQTVQRMQVSEGIDGSEQISFVEADTVTPGDRVLYSIDYTNESVDPIDNVKLVMPVPTEVAYVENSATGEGASIAFSVDGGTSFAPRGELTVSVDGASRIALAEEITHIKWTFESDISPGGAGDVSYLGLLK
ncbi:MAG: hypothetical protein V3V03_00855 [Hyphomonadaceae bacterium]